MTAMSRPQANSTSAPAEALTAPATLANQLAHSGYEALAMVVSLAIIDFIFAGDKFFKNR
jgi:hypothetical protein